MMTRHLRGVLSECVRTGVHTFGRIFTLAIYGVLYQCDSGYVGIRGETWILMTYQEPLTQYHSLRSFPISEPSCCSWTASHSHSLRHLTPGCQHSLSLEAYQYQESKVDADYLTQAHAWSMRRSEEEYNQPASPSVCWVNSLSIFLDRTLPE